MAKRNRFVDFDKFLAEKRNAAELVPVTFELGGVVYTLPAELPALVSVDALRLEQAGIDGDVPAQGVMAVATSLFGETQFNAILASGISVEELGDLIQQIMAMYGEVMETVETDESGNAPTPEAPGETST
jgi:hypothetical protein